MSTRSAIICLSGRSQAWGPSGSGLWDLYEDLCNVYFDRRQDLVAFREWDSDSSATARLIASRKPRTVIAIAYSWGCGFGLTQLADELAKQPDPRRIHKAFCVDPVPHWSFVPARALAMTRWGDYTLPESVDAADYWRQLNDAPHGRQVVTNDRPQRIYCRGVWATEENIVHAKQQERGRIHISAIGHSEIDDSPYIREAIIAGIADQLREDT